MSDSVQKAEVTTPVTNVWSLSVICVLAWIIPGLGHFLLRRYGRAIIFLVLITFLFFWGLDLGAKIYQYEPQQPLTFFALIAQVGMGLPYFIARFIASYAMMHPTSVFHAFAENFQFGNGNIENVTFEYGNTFTIVAGLLNFLVVLDAYDIAVGRKRG
jgi:hypothetical protein